MNNIFYTYLLIDSRDNKPFYVGKGKGKRMYEHVRSTLRGRVLQRNLHKFNKIKQIYNNGGKVLYKKIVKNVLEVVAYKFEILLIKRYGRNNLVNMTDGGEGKIGWKATKITRIKMSKSKIGKNNSFYGKHHSEETKNKLSKNHKGFKHSEESKKKMSESRQNFIPWNTGKKLSLEHRKKLSEIRKGKKLSLEHRKNISKSLKGRIPWNKGIKNFKNIKRRVI